MKRTGNLFQKIIEKDNVKQSIILASKGKKWRKAVKLVLSDLEGYSEKIHNLLKDGSYKPCKVRERFILEGSRRKLRHITTISFYPDQIIHWCIIKQLEPYFIKWSYRLSCGSIKNRGSIDASRHIIKWLNIDFKNTKYCAKLDIRHFYQSIRHDYLINLLESKFKDKNLMTLLVMIINHWQESEGIGLPIGFLPSQHFANFVLTPLDFYIKQELKAKYYVRYMDDMVLFSSNKRKLHKAVQAIARYLNNAGLTLKENWQVFKTDSRPLDFLGFRFYRDKTTLRKALMLKISKAARKIRHKYSPKVNEAKSIMSYMGWIRHSDSYGFFKKRIESHINIKIARKIISKFDSKRSKENENLQFRINNTATND